MSCSLELGGEAGGRSVPLDGIPGRWDMSKSKSVSPSVLPLKIHILGSQKTVLRTYSTHNSVVAPRVPPAAGNRAPRGGHFTRYARPPPARPRVWQSLLCALLDPQCNTAPREPPFHVLTPTKNKHLHYFHQIQNQNTSFTGTHRTQDVCASWWPVNPGESQVLGGRNELE